MGIVYTSGGGGRVFKHVLGSNTWVSVNDPIVNSAFYDLKISPESENKFVNVGFFNLDVVPSIPGIRITTDQGLTYNTPTGNLYAGLRTGKFHSVSYPNTDTIVAVGDSGLVSISNNGGASFDQPSFYPTPSGVLTPGTYSRAVYFLDNQVGIVSFGNKLFKTLDAGSTPWQEIIIPPTTVIQDLYISINQQLIIVVSKSEILKSSDGGATFSSVKSIALGERIKYQHGNFYVTAGKGALYISYDLGTTWTPDIVPSENNQSNFNSTFLEPDKGFVLNTSKVYKTIDSNLTIDSTTPVLNQIRLFTLDHKISFKVYKFRRCGQEATIYSEIVSGLEVGDVVTVEGQSGCWRFLGEEQRDTPGVSINVISIYPDCASCSGYMLTDCQDPENIIYTQTNLEDFVDLIVKIDYCDSCFLVEYAAGVPTEYQSVSIKETFGSCELCNPQPVIPAYTLIPRQYTPSYSLGACSNEYVEKWSCRLSEGLYNQVIAKRYGITMCCDIDIEKAYIKTELIKYETLKANNPCNTECNGNDPATDVNASIV